MHDASKVDSWRKARYKDMLLALATLTIGLKYSIEKCLSLQCVEEALAQLGPS
jgi:hypothetical protein